MLMTTNNKDGAALATPATDAPRRIAMLIYPGVAPLDVAGPLQVFGVANFLRRQKLYDVITVAPTRDPVPTPVGFAFLPGSAMSDLALPVDTLLVSGGGGPEAGTRPDILDFLRRAAPQARRFGSICTGAFALGAAGLIDDKRVATHWDFCGELARRHPATQVDCDSIFVRDGNLYSSAGISAGIDLALGLLEEDHGRDFALKVARYLVLFMKRSGGQAQFSTHMQAQFSSVPAIEKAQRWCHDHLDGDLRVGETRRDERAQFQPHLPDRDRAHAGGLRRIDPLAGRAPPARGKRHPDQDGRATLRVLLARRDAAHLPARDRRDADVVSREIQRGAAGVVIVPSPRLRERATQIDRQSRLGEGASPRTRSRRVPLTEPSTLKRLRGPLPA
jgi:transcriptional regulator GlxA family with amidase domain